MNHCLHSPINYPLDTDGTTIDAQPVHVEREAIGPRGMIPSCRWRIGASRASSDRAGGE
jgi:hypothetical protein